MNAIYHRQITTEALQAHVQPAALEIIIQANLHQDDLKYLLGKYPHFHFDDNLFARTYAYLDEQRQLVQNTFAHGLPPREAWEAFGRITHTLQDFYAHSNYVRLWLHPSPRVTWPDPETIDPLQPELLQHPQLMTGRVVMFIEILNLIPGLGRLLTPFYPADTHARMNLDHPQTGPLFPYAMVAARKRTEAEFETLKQLLSKQDPLALPLFIGHPTPSRPSPISP